MMSATTGFRYGTLSQEVLAMSDELERLGGGADARVAKLQVLCKVGRGAGDLSDQGIVASGADGNVAVRDPRCPADTPAAEAQRRYRIPLVSGDTAAFDDTCQDVLEWLEAGFNCTVMAYGQAGTGKTHSILGPMHTASLGGGSFLSAALSGLFRLQASSGGGWRVALSSWEMVSGDDAADLFGPLPGNRPQSGPKAPQGDFVSVEVRSLREAEQALRHARSRSCNWASGPDGVLRALSNRAHAFLRLQLLDSDTGRSSALHLVDLVGSRPLEGPGSSPRGPRPADPLSQAERERRTLNRQMLAFSRVVSELSQQEGIVAGGGQNIAAARETKLTAALAPLLVGNTRAVVLATVSPRASDFLDTINTLRVSSRLQALRVACMRSGPMAPDHLAAWVPASEALSLLAQAPRQSSPEQQPFIAALDGAKRSSGHRGSRNGGAPSSASPTKAVSQHAALPSVGAGAPRPQATPNLLEADKDLSSPVSLGGPTPPEPMFSFSSEPAPGWDAVLQEAEGTAPARQTSSAPKRRSQPAFKPAHRQSGSENAASLSSGPVGYAALHGPKRSQPRKPALEPRGFVSPPESPSPPIGSRSYAYELTSVDCSQDSGAPWASRGASQRTSSLEDMTNRSHEWAAERYSRGLHSTPAGGNMYLTPASGAVASAAPTAPPPGSNATAALPPPPGAGGSQPPGLLEPPRSESYSNRPGQVAHPVSATPQPQSESGSAVTDGRRFELSQPAVTAGRRSDERAFPDHCAASAGKSSAGIKPWRSSQYLDGSQAASPYFYEGSLEVGISEELSSRNPAQKFWQEDFQKLQAVPQSASSGNHKPMPMAPLLIGADSDGRVGAEPSQPAAECAPLEERSGLPPGVGSSVHAEVVALQGQNEWLVGLLQHERKTSEALKGKLEEADTDLNEIAAQYEVKLSTAQQENAELRARCRKLEGETQVAAVFEDYNRQIQSLQATVSQLREENSELLQMISELQDAKAKAGRSDPMKAFNSSAEAAAPAAAGSPDGRMQPASRVQALQRQLRRAEADRDRAIGEAEKLRRHGRTAKLLRSQSEDSMRRVRELQVQLSKREREAMDRGLAAAEASGKADMLEIETARLRELHKAVVDENQALKQSVATLRQAVSSLRQARRREVVEAALPRARGAAHSGGRGRGAARRGSARQARALELVRLIEREFPAKNPKVDQLVNRLLAEISEHTDDMQRMAEREETLMRIATGEQLV